MAPHDHRREPARGRSGSVKPRRRRWNALELHRRRSASRRTFRAGIFPVTVGKKAIGKRLAAGPTAPLLCKQGVRSRRERGVVAFRGAGLKPGRYVYAIRMSRATMNTQRPSVFVSRAVPRRGGDEAHEEARDAPRSEDPRVPGSAS